MLPPRPFCLIRHGETNANRDRIIAGTHEAQLTECGRAAARAIAGREAALARMAGTPGIMVFCSPQERAVETARLAFPGHAPLKLAGLRERNWGIYEGRPVGEQPPRDATPEQGESWPDMMARVGLALREALTWPGDHLPVLVAHSGVIRATRALLGRDPGGPSPANATPFLYLPKAAGWQECPLAPEKDQEWTV